ncbi:hypothetical protein [Pedobacter sp. MC2016-24]|uniref:hypothetical protein n=1 Tax=Pedobacter sp. MC2016-24 TaxID=2780090 RepID=UPI00187FECF9|nr:hypothetical protein [Pedobacter sp. MC2016-24]MBE9600011.1 hypothetical protein [Pedobacter sp. MC2016-24]
MEEENKIDQFFRQGLDSPDIPFKEMDWEKMEAKLDQQDKKRIFPMWLFTASGIAAALALFAFWYFAESRGVQKIRKNPELTINTPRKSRQQPGTRQTIEKQNTAKPTTIKPSLTKAVPLLTNTLIKETLQNESAKNIKTEQVQLLALNNDSALHPPFETAKMASIALIDPEKITVQELLHIRKAIEDKSKPGLFKNQGLTLSFIAAPDISVTKMSKPSKLSSNLGILANYNLTTRLSVTSGLIYSRKRYNYTGFGQQNNAAAYPWDVNADCNVLDIPVNVNYRLLDHKKYSISLNAGASSYVMLKEKYQFRPSNPASTQNPRSIEINNENQYLFGVANIGVSFNREISRGLSIGVQPFIKLPLTGIGYGNARLRSTGVSFSLNLGLFPNK